MDMRLGKKEGLGIALLALSFLLLSIHVAFGEESGADYAQPASAEAPVDSSQIERFSTEELHSLVAPIALYPDALLAQALPASAFSSQVVDANRFIEGGGNADSPPSDANWDSSVMALLHYPTVLKKMNDDPQWTEQLGMAVTYQMDDVSQAIQQVRSEAQAVGNLQTSDKQIVQSDAGAITIVPADPQVIYVPQYDPYYIYERRIDNPFVWGTGFSFGLWLGNTWDWRNHHIWRNNYWNHGRWDHYSRPSYWNGPRNRTIPSWYRRGGSSRGYGYDNNRVSPRGFPSRNETRTSRTFGNGTPRSGITTDRTPQTRTPQSRPQTGWDVNNRGNESRLESLRGQTSRTQRQQTPRVQSQPAVRQETQRAQPTPQMRQPEVRQPAVRAPQPQVQRTPAPRTPPQRSAPSFNEGFRGDRGSVQRESSRGSASRGGGGGGGRSSGGGGSRGGGHR